MFCRSFAQQLHAIRQRFILWDLRGIWTGIGQAIKNSLLRKKNILSYNGLIYSPIKNSGGKND